MLTVAVILLALALLVVAAIALAALRAAHLARLVAERAVLGMAAELARHLEEEHPACDDALPARSVRIAHLRGLVARVAAIDATIETPQCSAERLLLAQERAQGAQARAQLRALGEEA